MHGTPALAFSRSASNPPLKCRTLHPIVIFWECPYALRGPTTEHQCPDPSSSRSPQPGIRRHRSGAGIVTTYPPPPMRRRSTDCWKRFPRWRSICCRTTTPTLRRNRCFCRSPHCADRLRAEWLRSIASWRRIKTSFGKKNIEFNSN